MEIVYLPFETRVIVFLKIKSKQKSGAFAPENLDYKIY